MFWRRRNTESSQPVEPESVLELPVCQFPIDGRVVDVWSVDDVLRGAEPAACSRIPSLTRPHKLSSHTRNTYRRSIRYEALLRKKPPP